MALKWAKGKYQVKNPDKYIEEYSHDFETTFMDLFRRKYPGQVILANKVYQEYIVDKESTHMNATKWATLTEFVEVKHHFRLIL